tara:strand:+ start:2532 stop:2741 length:210 start_codon:yes stop_codon:yes gene_type:complete
MSQEINISTDFLDFYATPENPTEICITTVDSKGRNIMIIINSLNFIECLQSSNVLSVAKRNLKKYINEL